MSIPRMSASPVTQFRPRLRTSNKIIFISCEGSVTEEEYFSIVSDLYPNIKSKIQFVSVKEDIISIPVEQRTQEQNDELNKSAPQHLVQKIDDFKNNPDKIRIYEFDKHPDDEFWIVADVDNHTETGGNLKNWNKALSDCKNKNYGYAISNPFFELWLLLHHDEAKIQSGDNDNDSDSQWAVTSSHSYEPTDHFLKRLSTLGANLKDKKHVNAAHYNKEKINNAIKRAKALDTIPPCDYPTDLGTTVYRLLESIAEIDSQYGNN